MKTGGFIPRGFWQRVVCRIVGGWWQIGPYALLIHDHGATFIRNRIVRGDYDTRKRATRNAVGGYSPGEKRS